ncbi:MAG: septum formation initiator family protein [Bdellovibrionales bacterium]|nr:septum formation initiator family protein [Bdellovibrionales bacterium]
MLTEIHRGVTHFLHRPKSVAMWCLVLSLSGLLVEGSLLSWLRLLSEERVMAGELVRLKADNTRLKTEVSQTKDPKLIEREARERLDLVQKNDLIFVFSDGE